MGGSRQPVWSMRAANAMGCALQLFRYPSCAPPIPMPYEYTQKVFLLPGAQIMMFPKVHKCQESFKATAASLIKLLLIEQD